MSADKMSNEWFLLLNLLIFLLLLFQYFGRKFLSLCKKILSQTKTQANENSASFENLKKSNKDKDFYSRFPYLSPLAFFHVPTQKYRLNLLINDLSQACSSEKNSQALILSVLFSNKFDIPLRIISREQYNPREFISFLKFQKIDKPKNLEFYSDFDCRSDRNALKLELSEKDIFLATSWWTAHVVKNLHYRKTFFYHVDAKEDFQIHHEEQKMLQEDVLQHPNVKFIIDSNFLLESFSNPCKEHLKSNYVAFNMLQIDREKNWIEQYANVLNYMDEHK